MDSFRIFATLVAALLSFTSTHAQNLTAVKCNGALPTGRSDLTILYDNDDSIYIFGGTAGNRDFADAIKYSITEDTTEVIGQLPYSTRGGGAVINKFRNIFYLSGVGGKDIHQYLPDLRSFVKVSSFADYTSYFATVPADIDTAFIFGGYHDPKGVMSLNLNTLESERVGQLPEDAIYTEAIWDEENDVAYIFTSRTVQKYDRSSNTTEKLPVQVPIKHSSYGAVWDGRFAYLIGFVTDVKPVQSIVQFDPISETFTFIPVEGFEPVDFTTAVYVEKLNRIYWFGGHHNDERGYQDGIWYIDLDLLTQPPTTTTTEETSISTMDPDIFNCRGRPDSNYPYPGDCTKFVICREDHGYPFDCSEGLHFDPVNRHCTFPDKAGCV